MEVFVELGAVVRAECAAKRRGVVKHGIQHAAAFGEASAGAAMPPGSTPKSRSKTLRGLSSAGSGTPSREKASVVELFGWPVPELMDSSSDGKRVCFDVTSAMSWSHETVL